MDLRAYISLRQRSIAYGDLNRASSSVTKRELDAAICNAMQASQDARRGEGKVRNKVLDGSRELAHRRH